MSRKPAHGSLTATLLFSISTVNRIQGVAAINTRYRLITFDVYTALFDIENSLTPLVNGTLHGPVDGLSFTRAWRRKQLEYALISNSLSQARIPFETITQRALDDTLARFHVELAQTSRASLLEAWRNLQPWPEAIDVLNTLKAHGYSLGLLSNGDTDALHALSAKFPPVIDHIFSSEQAGSYKPHPSIYALPLHRLNMKVHEILHVAGSPIDVLGTKAAGLRCAWSNREQQPHLDPSYKADYETRDLAGLLEVLVKGDV